MVDEFIEDFSSLGDFIDEMFEDQEGAIVLMLAQRDIEGN